MKFTYEKYPVLRELTHHGDFFKDGGNKFGVFATEVIAGKLSTHWDLYNKAFSRIRSTAKNNVNYLSNNIYSKLNDGKIGEKLFELRDKLIDSNGVLILPAGHLFVYSIKTIENSKRIEVFKFQKNIWFSYILCKWELKENGFQFLNKDMYFDPEYSHHGFPIDQVMANVIIFELFKQYAEIETKLVKPKDKPKERIKRKGGQLASREFPYKINIINSTWFTKIVRSEGFKVKGHFRLQPCGEGLKDRKLIWVNEFQKSGYTRRSQKEIQEELTP